MKKRTAIKTENDSLDAYMKTLASNESANKAHVKYLSAAVRSQRLNLAEMKKQTLALEKIAKAIATCR